MAHTQENRHMDGQNVFISYSSKNAQDVAPLLTLLQELGISYWKAPEQIPAGSSYAREIPRAIQNCDIFLLVLSRTAQESIWVEKEVDMAVCSRKTIIPYQLDSAPLNSMYRFYLNNVQMIMADQQPQKAMEELKRQLLRLLERQDPPLAVGLGIAELDDTQKERSRTKSRKSEAFMCNPTPQECEYCGGELEMISVGVYRCTDCGRENYDAYRKVRRYLEENGPASAIVIARQTGVPRRLIDAFFREEYLEIPKYSPIRLSCTQCGAPIRTGTLCERCKQQANATAPAPSSSGAVWHSHVGRRKG